MLDFRIPKGKYIDMEYNSRKIKKGDLFVALEGSVVDGHNYIEDAIKNGAIGIVHTKNIEKKEGIEYYQIDNLREKLGVISSEFYGWPQEKIKIIGVTGTNGKTTITYLIEEILGEENVARIGTVEYKIGDEVIEAPNTTPESLDIVKFCKKIVEKKIPYLVMEVSSHALMLGRVNMLKFHSVAFSNLTPEHLDFHKNMDEYYLAKREIFKLLKLKENSVINMDDEYGAKYFQEVKGLSYGINLGELRGKRVGNSKSLVEFSYKDKKTVKNIKLLGDYNLYNILAAVGLALKMGYEWDYIMEKVESMKGAPGRFEMIDCKQDFLVIADYAHSADAIENVLKTAKKLEIERIITVFGCGGDRDKTKRPLMTKAALEYSDVVIITTDNPRTEEPQNIIRDMVENINSEKIMVVQDREEAIKKAVKVAEKNDIIIVLGKGHETYQIVGRIKYHFDDREILRREILKKMEGKNVDK